MSKAVGEIRVQLGVIRSCRRADIDPKRPKLRICLYDRKGRKLLGRHPNKPAALRQERAIQVRKRV